MNIEQILKSLPLFKNLPDTIIRNLADGAAAQKYNKGKVLFIHGEAARSYYLLRSGWIKLFRETLDGTQAVIDILHAGSIFGDSALFDQDTYPYSAEVVEAAEIIALPLGQLKQAIETDHGLALAMLRATAEKRQQQDSEIEHRSVQSAPQRIGCFILRLVHKDSSGPVTVHLPYDKTLVAARLGMQPETFSRALSKLRHETGIHVRGASIEIKSIDQLSRYSCSACSSSFPCKTLHAAG